MEERRESYDRGLFLGELIHVFVKNILWEILIFILVIGIGVGVAAVNDDYYVASAIVSVKARASNNALDYNDTILAGYYVDEVCELAKDDVFLEKVRLACEGKTKTTVNSSAVTAQNAEDSLIISFTYTDADKEDAAIKLRVLVEQLKIFLETGNYFNANLSIEPILSVENTIVSKVVSGSNDRNIVLVSFAAAAILVILFAFVMFRLNDNIISVEKLERVTNKKNFASVKQTNVAEKIDANKLADALIWHSNDNGNKVYQIQSTVSGEGKTTVAVNLAKELGESQRKVLLIDCDLDNARLHQILNLTENNGLTDIVNTNLSFEKAIKDTEYKNVDVITSGGEHINHTRLFASRKFEEMVKTVSEKYDFVLIDCGAVKENSDYVNVSKCVDATLMVVKKESTNSAEIANAIEELDNFGANVVGTVFNFAR